MRTTGKILEDAEILFTFLSDTGAPPDTADVVLAMGSHDLNVADTAARAFHRAHAEWLICSGGFGKDTAGVLREPEGVLYARRCQAAGVPGSRILIERRATNSGENFRFSKALLDERRAFPRVGMIACKPYMSRRALATGEKQWPEVRWGVFPQKTGLTEYLDQGNDMTAVLNLMVGDLQRLRAYSGSFQAPVTVPDPVWAAHERLAADGYDRFIIRES